MRPMAALLGIILGSAVAMFAGLAMTGLVYLLLPEFSDRLAGEYRPLWTAVALSGLLAGVAAAAFVGEIRQRRWRSAALGALALSLAGFAAWYWPR